jgi:DNA-binding NtrC family response regulator
VRITRAIVPAGTQLRVGDTTLAVEDAGQAVAPPPPSDVPRSTDLVGDSDAIREVARLVHRLARVDSSVLIQGETGTGKEVVARAIHEASPRRDHELVVVDCGSMPGTLIASILFGHEKGAFTGADQRRAGAFERAAGGTVLLDEIGELPLDVQPALLGVLERRAFTRVGGSQSIAVDVRVLAATHRDLRAEVNAGRFRADLYYRLAVAKILIPPLRERPEDIEPLVAHFVQRLTGVAELGPLATALDQLRAHPWSGNVRELRNVVEAALVMGELDLGNSERPVQIAGTQSAVTPYRDARAAALTRFEAEYLRALIDRADGNASEAARLARMDRPYLLTLLRKHGLRS